MSDHFRMYALKSDAEGRLSNMMYPSPDVLSRLIQERQARLQATVAAPSQDSQAGLRVRIGHALIAAGSTLSGERVEFPTHRHRRPLSRAA